MLILLLPFFFLKSVLSPVPWGRLASFFFRAAFGQLLSLQMLKSWVLTISSCRCASARLKLFAAAWLPNAAV